MFISILNLDFKRAFSYNVFAFLLLVLSCIYYTIKIIMYILTNKTIRIPNQIIYIIIIIGLIFGLLRNIPSFSFLAP